MGMYTEIFFRAAVDEGAYMEMLYTSEHSLVMNSGSAYFPEVAPTGPKFHHDPRYNTYTVEFRSSMKNYHGEIEDFFAWVAPHCAHTNTPGGFIGYSLYEEDRCPTLFFADGSKTKPKESPDGR